MVVKQSYKPVPAGEVHQQSFHCHQAPNWKYEMINLSTSSQTNDRLFIAQAGKELTANQQCQVLINILKSNSSKTFTDASHLN